MTYQFTPELKFDARKVSHPWVTVSTCMIRIHGGHSVFEWYVTATKLKPLYLLTEKGTRYYF